VGVGVVLLLVVVAGGALAVVYDQPHVQSVESEFGDVAEEEAEVNTRVVVQNPNDRALPGRFDLGYFVTLNGVEVASGTEPGVRIEPGRNTVQTTAAFDNSKIPEWWVTHINRGEQTTMKTRARIGLIGGVGPTVPAEERTIETDLLGPLADENASTLRVGDNDLLVVGEQTGEWGEADAETTPLRFTTRLENVHDRPVRLDGTDYEIRMNGVVVGEGRTDDGIELAPGESGNFTVTAALDTPKMQRWWVTHLRNGESTDLQIEVYAVVDDGEQRKRLPLTVFERRATFETDLLGTGRTAVELRETEPAPEFSEPRVEETSSEWGAVRDDETEIETTVDLVNRNDGELSELLTLEVHQRTTLAGVTIAEGTDRVEELPQGTGQIAVTTTKPHSVVPEWWAAHLRNGEVSETRTEIDAEADVGVTTLPLDLENRSSTVETDLLGDLNDDSTQTVRSDRTGQRMMTVYSTAAEWRDPTPEEGPIVVEADIQNDNQLSSVTIREVDYTVDINSVRLADDRAPEEHTLAPGERRTVQFTIVLNNSKMEEWWPTHVRNGEVSQLNRTVMATVEVDGETERVELDFLSDESTVETDLLADE
jgi:LEA14-like dessication related protein